MAHPQLLDTKDVEAAVVEMTFCIRIHCALQPVGLAIGQRLRANWIDVEERGDLLQQWLDIKPMLG